MNDLNQTCVNDGWASLTPHGIVALGAPLQGQERMIGLQSLIYRCFVALSRLRFEKVRIAVAKPRMTATATLFSRG